MEGYTIFGVVAFVCVMYLYGELNKLKKTVDRMKSRRKIEKGESKEMSRLIKELQGKWCMVESDDLDEEKVQICDVDEEWVKAMYIEKATKQEPEREKYVLIRIDSIESVEILPENA